MSIPSGGPIADLSYRNYTGPKGLAKLRWWPIVKSGLRSSFKKKGFWVLAVVSLLPYIPVFFMVLLTTLRGTTDSSFLPEFPSLVGGLYSSGFWPLMLALMVGAGSIAADNRSNALQVYLSKPITKTDYLIGKWMYIFLVVFAVYFAPLFLLTVFEMLTLGFGDFFGKYGLLFPKLLLLSIIPAVVHASALVGISAWNKTPWLVGVIYAGIYIFTSFLAIILAHAISGLSFRAAATVSDLSIGGAIAGVGTNILGAAPRSVLPGPESSSLPYPLPLWLILIGISIVGLLLASRRIRAVEVVQG